jgi:hypothetical protein
VEPDATDEYPAGELPIRRAGEVPGPREDGGGKGDQSEPPPRIAMLDHHFRLDRFGGPRPMT